MKKFNICSHPAQALQGRIPVPGDKSISHRSLILGAIAQGVTLLEGFLFSEDCLATMHILTALGVNIEKTNAGVLTIQGVGKYGLKPPKAPLDCGNSGTSMRLLAGLLAGQNFDSTLVGDRSLMQRPMQRIRIPLQQMGALIESTTGCAPLVITASSGLKGIDYLLPEASAQVKSCLLLAGLYAQGQTRIIEPKPSRDHTERMLKAMGYPLKREANTLSLDSKKECRGITINIPGDLSSAAFFVVAACLIPGSAICIEGVGINPTRTGIITLLKAMGADITTVNKRYYGQEPVADLEIRYAPLRGINVPEELIPLAIDELPILCIAAASAQGITSLRGAQELRVKESDRISAIVAGLQKLGIEAKEFEDGLEIRGGKLQGGKVDSFGDHRIAMSFTVAGACAQGPVEISDCGSIATSFPDFIDKANSINMRTSKK